MAFESLSNKLQDVFKQLRGKGKLTEKDVKTAMREVKLALLEADVNFKIVKDFVNKVTEKAVGGDVLEGLNPGQQVVKIVNDELVTLMGSTQSKLTFSSKSPTIYMMVGLQGAGKTTTTGKLAGQLRKQGKQPLLVACDVYRPAAIKQLQVVGSTYNIPVFEMGQGDPVEISKEGIKYATGHGHDVVIIDTAGRLHIDENLMDELLNIKNEVKPQEILLVIDAMTGQDAVNVAETFNSKLGVDGVIITKMDGDTRGGAALSVKAVTGKPILYVGMGEKLSDLEQFYPDRMASRILGMGDVLSLIEKAEAEIDEEKAREMTQKLKKNQFDFDDYLESIKQMKNMGGLGNIMNMLPGLGGMGSKMKGLDDEQTAEAERKMGRMEAIIHSMTPAERANPDILSPSRKHRIAKGAGVDISEVNRMIKQFNEMKKLMKQFGKPGKKKKFGFPF